MYTFILPQRNVERIIKRNRKGESIPIEYLKRCHEYHENWLNSYSKKIIIDNEEDTDNNINSANINIVKDFISDFIQKYNNEEISIENYIESLHC